MNRQPRPSVVGWRLGWAYVVKGHHEGNQPKHRQHQADAEEEPLARKGDRVDEACCVRGHQSDEEAHTDGDEPVDQSLKEAGADENILEFHLAVQQVGRRYCVWIEWMNQSLPAREEHRACHGGREYDADFEGERETEQH